MRFTGGVMVFLGVASLLMDATGQELMMLSWIDSWGSSVAQAIRIGLIVVGAVLILAAGRRKSADG